MIRPPRISPLFPYPTLSRSVERAVIFVGSRLGENLNAAQPQVIEFRREGVLVDANFANRFLGRQLSAAESVDKNGAPAGADRKSTRLNSSHLVISYAVFCLK